MPAGNVGRCWQRLASVSTEVQKDGKTVAYKTAYFGEALVYPPFSATFCEFQCGLQLDIEATHDWDITVDKCPPLHLVGRAIICVLIGEGLCAEFGHI